MTDSTEELLYLLTTLAGWYTLNSHQLSDDKLAACLHRLRQEQLQAVLELARLLSGTKTYPQDQNLIMPTRSHNIPIPGLPTPDSSTNHPLNEQRVGSLMVSDPSDQASQFEHRYPHGVNFEEESTDGPTRTPPQLVVPAVENESVAAEPQRARTNISGGRQLDSIARDRETERTITHGPKRSNPTTTKPHVPCSKKGTKRKRGESDQSIRELEARFPKLKVQEEEGAWLFSRRSENLASNDKILDSERSKSLDLCELRIDQDFFDQLDGCKGSVHEFLGKIDTHKVTGKSEVTRTFRRAMKAETSPPLTKVYGRFACYSFYELLLSNGSHNGGSFRRGQLQATVQQLNSEDPEHQVSIKHVGRQADIGKKLHHMIKKHFFGDPGYLFVLPISLSNDRISKSEKSWLDAFSHRALTLGIEDIALELKCTDLGYGLLFKIAAANDSPQRKHQIEHGHEACGSAGLSLPAESPCIPNIPTPLPSNSNSRISTAQVYMESSYPTSLPMEGNPAELVLPDAERYPRLRPQHVYRFNEDAFRQEISTGTWFEAPDHQDFNFDQE